MKSLPANAEEHKRHRFNPWVVKIPWRRAWPPIPVFCLESLMDRGAWWATVQGVAKSPTWLNRNMIHVKKKKKKEQTSVKNSQSLMSLVSLRFLSPGPVFWKVRIYWFWVFIFRLTFGSFLEDCPHSSSFQNMNTGFTVTDLCSLIHL